MWYEWLYIILLILGLASAIAVTILSWIARHSRSARWLMSVGAGFSILIFAYFMFSIVPSVEQTKFWMQVVLTTIHLLPLFFLAFALVYAGHSQWVSWRYWLLVLVYPSIYITIVWVFPDHLWTSREIDFSGLVNISYRTFSFWFTIHAIHNYILVFAAFAVLLLHTIRSGPRLRMQTWAINIAFLVPGIVVTAQVMGLTQGWPNLIPIGIGLTAVLLLVAFYRSGFLALTPFMNTAIINNMHDAMFVTSENHVLVSVNAAARRLMGHGTSNDLVGRLAQEVLGPSWAPILSSQLDENITEFVHEVEINGYTQKFEIRAFAVNEDVVDGVRHVYMLREATDRLHMQAELRRSEEKYRQLVESGHQGMTIMQVNPMKIIFSSKPMETLLGYTTEETLNATQQELTARIYPADVERAFKNVESWLKGEFTPPPTMSYRIVRKDGEVRWMDVSSTLVEHEGQIAIQSVYQDVTEKIAAQDSLREINQRFDELVRNIPLLVLRFRLIDGHFVFDYLSPRCAECLGVSASEALSNPELIEQVFTQSGMRRLQKAHDQALGHMTTLEWEGAVMLGDQQRWGQIMARPTRTSDEDVVWDGFYIDITDRKEIEDALRHSQLQLEEAQEIARLGSWQWNARTQTSNYSEELYRIHGFESRDTGRTIEGYLAYVHPDDRQMVADSFRHAIEKRELRPLYYRIMHPQNGLRILYSSGRIVEDDQGELLYLLGILQDVTERKRAEDALAIQNRYLNTLHEISLDLLNRRELDDLLQAIVDNLAEILETTYGRLLLLDGEDLVIQTYTDNLSFLIGQRIPEENSRLSWQAINTLQPVVMDDYQAFQYRAADYDVLNLGSVVCLPVVVGGKAIGVLELARIQGKAVFSADQVQVGIMFSQLAALVLDNVNQYSAALEEISDRSRTEARLNALAEELKRKNQTESDQRSLAEALIETSSVLNSTLDVDEILALILETIKPIVPHDSSAIMLIDNGVASVVQHSGLQIWAPEIRYRLDNVPHLNYMYETRQHCIINDVNAYSGWQEAPGEVNVRSYLAVPIQVDGDVIGFLNVDGTQPNHFNQEHATRLKAFVNQAGIALKNARLYEQSTQLAAVEERQRLARDLHDSVTQTLFSSTIMVDTIIKLWQNGSADIEEDLMELRDLSYGALAEMRTMLLELRPDRVVDTNLADLIVQLMETLKGRSRIQPHLSLTDEPVDGWLLPDIKVTFFRIAQESVNNVVKHSRASNVWVDLTCAGDFLTLSVRDDGRGFDPDVDSVGHMGLEIMQERALAIQANLVIQSQNGQGSKVILNYQLGASEASHE